MLTDTFRSISVAARNVFGNWRSMLLVAIVYASFLGALYLFVLIREASLTQVTLTFVLALAVPILFFVLQAMIANEHDQVSLSGLLKRSLINFWKLIVVTLPLIALAILIAYLLARAQTRFASTVPEGAAEFSRRVASSANPRNVSKPIDWRAAVLLTIRYLVFGLLLPLAAIHLWVAAAREGLGRAIRKILTLASRAFSPQSILTYLVGFLVFGVIPYFLLFRTTPVKFAWLELSLFILRLAAVFALTLFGWVITVKAIALSSADVVAEAPSETA